MKITVILLISFFILYCGTMSERLVEFGAPAGNLAAIAGVHELGVATALECAALAAFAANSVTAILALN